jgi:hypothetical protein
MDDFKVQDEGLPPSVINDILDSAPKAEPISQPIVEPIAQNNEAEQPLVEEAKAHEEPEDEDKQLSELPEFAKRRIAKNERKYGRQIDRLSNELDTIKQQNLQMQQILLQQITPQQSGSNDYVKDPITGDLYASDSEEAKFARYYQKVEEAKQRQNHQQSVLSQKERIAQKLDVELAKLAEKHDDFTDVMGSVLGKIGFQQGYTAVDHPITAIAALSPEGAEVMYRLGKNPEELNLLSRMSPEDQASRFLDLVTNFKLNSKSSNAPPPNKRTVNPPTASPSKTVDPFDSYEETLAMMRKNVERGR